MDLYKTAELIERIKKFHDSLIAMKTDVSNIEKDILLQYTKELYEQIMISKPSEFQKQILRNTSFTETAAAISDKDFIQQKVITPVIDNLRVSPPVFVEIETKATVEPTPQIPVEIEPEIKEIPVIVHQPIAIEVSKFSKLFNLDNEDGNSLSVKLGSKPISDIHSSLGINDRFQILNELFDGDKTFFAISIDRLNDMTSFDRAKDYICQQLAEKYQWTHESKIDQAKEFIRLIRRRYL